MEEWKVIQRQMYKKIEIQPKPLCLPRNPFDEYLRDDHDSKEEAKIKKEKPDFEPSGKLVEDTNNYRSRDQ
ncbi:hypothetical protein X798_08031 [Onchocerca flexuosa]|uniref:Uncharacterized protein n=1 Tax=Onchocerca flexuosa TaxID=387005 RepID=A0A238BK90_9BILA|nr:hypothetical protein X798_08031 [Onchocerca flexuosa]